MKAMLISTLIGVTLITIAHSEAFNFSECTSSFELNPADLSCDACGTNLIANNYQTVAIVCQCATGFLSSTGGTCTAISYAPCSGINYYAVYNLDGSSNTASACATCDSTAYPNA